MSGYFKDIPFSVQRTLARIGHSSEENAVPSYVELWAIICTHPVPWIVVPSGTDDCGPPPLLSIYDADGSPIIIDCVVERRSYLEAIVRFINTLFNEN